MEEILALFDRAAFFFDHGFGNSPYSPFWPIFHLLGGGYSHFSTRSFLISDFFIALCAGLSLSYLVTRWRLKSPWVDIVSCLAVVFVIYNLFAVLSPVRQYMATNARQYENFQAQNPFSQVAVTLPQEFRFGNSSMVDLLLQNTGTSNGYEALPIPSHVHARNSPDYRGEFYLQQGAGQLAITSWSPNRWVVKIRVAQNDILVVNQNYDPGWKVNAGKTVVNVNGLIGLK